MQLSAPGQTTLTYPVPCAAATCQTLFAAPAGLWTFGVTLYSGPGQTGSVLAQGTTTEAIALGANTVALTFNAVVASASVTIDPSEAPPYLSSIGPTNARLDVAFKDPSGATIIGPNLFVAAGNPTCIPT
ncbi:MAG TPA: hypothetical protein VKG44_05165, partial [Candidatus Baltobacteraceae bacterium]|nr:hypothetical protein [Candidatus Baltobacteraceae bacterium]